MSVLRFSSPPETHMHSTGNKHRWLKLAAIVLMLAILANGFNFNLARASSSYSWIPSPQGNIGVTTPEIRIKLIFDQLQLVSSKMYLNQKEVKVRYEADLQKQEHQFKYVPDQPLKSGRYDVLFIFTFAGYHPSETSWSFTVDADASFETGPPNANQTKALKAVNRYRSLLGLNPVSADDRLNASATAHAQYQSLNGTISHAQQLGKKGFTGENVLMRTQYFGYDNDQVFEIISKQNNASPEEAVDGLFDAPYHRIPYMHPNLQDVGYGSEHWFHVIHFGASGGDSPIVRNSEQAPLVVVSPGDREAMVPVSWSGNETPDPLRLHSDAAYPVGYPIVAGVYDDGVSGAAVKQAHMTDADGKQIPLLWNDMKDDSLRNHVIIIPSKPLKPSVVYSVELQLLVSYTDDRTKILDMSWQFMTEREPGLGKRTLHAYPNQYKTLYDPLSGMVTAESVVYGLGQPYYLIRGVKHMMSIKPVVLSGITYFSVRELAKALNAEVDWDMAEKSVKYTKKDREVTLYTEKPFYSVDGKLLHADTPALLIDGRTMIPLRLLAETLGYQVSYEKYTRTVGINE